MTNAVQDKKFNIAIIGAGKVGQTFKHLFRSVGHPVSLIGRDIEESHELINKAKLILITTTDQAIEKVCSNISSYLNPESVVSHCSGALSSDLLLSAKNQGCAIASSHPLNTFPNLTAALATFSNIDHGTYLYCEGDNKAIEVLKSAFNPAGFNTIEIASNAKTAYHTACVFACNYLTVLMDISLQTAELEGIEKKQFWQAIQPLVQSTLNNISEHGTAKSLSGPIARGDTQTISTHLDLLSKSNSDISAIYLKLAEQALMLAKQQGKLSTEKIDALTTLLKE